MSGEAERTTLITGMTERDQSASPAPGQTVIVDGLTVSVEMVVHLGGHWCAVTDRGAYGTLGSN
jgi:hypothetical protein